MQPRTSDDGVPTPIAPPAGGAGLAEGTRPVATKSGTPRVFWLGIGLVVAVIALGMATLMTLHARSREQFEQQYPVVPDAAGQALIAREGPRWEKGEAALLRALEGFTAPPLASLMGAGACPFAAAPKTFAAGPALLAEVKGYVEDTIRAAARARFVSQMEQEAMLARLAAPIAVSAAGVTYAFDPATGRIACAGAPGALRAVE